MFLIRFSPLYFSIKCAYTSGAETYSDLVLEAAVARAAWYDT